MLMQLQYVDHSPLTHVVFLLYHVAFPQRHICTTHPPEGCECSGKPNREDQSAFTPVVFDEMRNSGRPTVKGGAKELSNNVVSEQRRTNLPRATTVTLYEIPASHDARKFCVRKLRWVYVAYSRMTNVIIVMRRAQARLRNCTYTVLQTVVSQRNPAKHVVCSVHGGRQCRGERHGVDES